MTAAWWSFVTRCESSECCFYSSSRGCFLSAVIRRRDTPEGSHHELANGDGDADHLAP